MRAAAILTTILGTVLATAAAAGAGRMPARNQFLVWKGTVSARGSRLVLRINGRITAELEDREKGRARDTGVLAVPVIPAPVKVQYRDIRLKVLAL